MSTRTAMVLVLALLGGCMAALGTTRAHATSLAVNSVSLMAQARHLGTARTCDATAAADAYARSDLIGVNFGTLPTMEINSNSLSTSRAFVRFNLDACAIPPNALVTSAVLRLTASSVASASVTYDVRRVTDAWNETSLSWTNQPGIAATPTASLTIAAGAAAGTAYEWNLIRDVQDVVAGRSGNAGWRVSDALEGSVLNRLIVFHSREALVIGSPRLSITYVD